jgi:hypothetical protein
LIGLLLLVALAAGAGGGYWLGSSQSERSAASRRATDSEPSWSLPSQGDAPSDDGEGVNTADDPADSLDAVLDLPDSGKRRVGLARLGETWARGAPGNAWQEALRVGDSKARLPLLRAIAAEWVQQEPARAFASVAELPPGWDRHQLLQQVCAEIARYDPQLALDLVAKNGLADADSYRGIIVDEWSRTSPADAARWIERQNPALQMLLAHRIAEAYVGQNPQEALDWALRLGGRSSARHLWAYMLSQMAEYDPREALRIALAAENSSQRAVALSSVLPVIAQSDPALAMSTLEKLPAGQMRMQTINMIAHQLSQVSIASAVEWLSSLDEEASRQAWSFIGGSIAFRDPDAAAGLLERVPREARSQWISSIAGAYAQSDPTKAIEWVKKFEDEPGYTMIVQHVAMTASGNDPEAALDMVNRLAEGERRERLIASMLPMIAQQQPEMLAGVIEDLTDANLRAEAIGQVAATWANYDMPAARKWVMSMPAGATRDHALTNLIGNGAQSEEDILSLIALVQSPEMRQNAVLSAAMRLGSSNPEALRTLLRRYPLDPRYQQHLERMLERQGAMDR